MISEETYKECKKIVEMYELQQKNAEIKKSLPLLEENMILEYQDLSGKWYEYTQELKDNIFFIPIRTRVRNSGMIC